jgi:hypothetical protein
MLASSSVLRVDSLVAGALLCALIHACSATPGGGGGREGAAAGSFASTALACCACLERLLLMLSLQPPKAVFSNLPQFMIAALHSTVAKMIKRRKEQLLLLSVACTARKYPSQLTPSFRGTIFSTSSQKIEIRADASRGFGRASSGLNPAAPLTSLIEPRSL